MSVKGRERKRLGKLDHVMLILVKQEKRDLCEENLLPDIAVPTPCFAPPQHIFTRAPLVAIQITSSRIEAFLPSRGKLLAFSNTH